MAACRHVFRTLPNIYKRAFFVKILNGFKLLTIFEKLRRRCLTGLKIGFKGFQILNLLVFQVYKLSQENTQPENICGIIFKKTKGRGEIVNRTSV